MRKWFGALRLLSRTKERVENGMKDLHLDPLYNQKTLYEDAVEQLNEAIAEAKQSLTMPRMVDFELALAKTLDAHKSYCEAQFMGLKEDSHLYEQTRWAFAHERMALLRMVQGETQDEAEKLS